MGVMDTITCPVTGKAIAQGEGKAASDSKGNIWIVHNSVGEVRSDSAFGVPTVNGHKPMMGPDA